MAYRIGSGWSDKMELECYLIMRKWEEQGMVVAELCLDLERRYKYSPPEKSLRAKVGNYKSLAGHTNPTNHSQRSKETYEKYKNFSIEDIEDALNKMR